MGLHEEAVRGDEPRFPVVECFTSVNGEGTHAGRLAAFVRFKGCNLACSYCDTMWANRPDAEAQMMTVSEIVTFVDESPATCVTLTGGEPLLQPGIDQIIKALLSRRMGRFRSRSSWIYGVDTGAMRLAGWRSRWIASCRRAACTIA